MENRVARTATIRKQKNVKKHCMVSPNLLFTVYGFPKPHVQEHCVWFPQTSCSRTLCMVSPNLLFKNTVCGFPKPPVQGHCVWFPQTSCSRTLGSQLTKYSYYSCIENNRSVCVCKTLATRLQVNKDSRRS